MASSSSPHFSPASDKRFWSTLRSRVDSLIGDKNVDPSLPKQINSRESNKSKRLKEDSLLLFRGFDSISQTLSQLSNNLDNALLVEELLKEYDNVCTLRVRMPISSDLNNVCCWE